MENYKRYRDAVEYLLENDGTAWVALGKAKDGTEICLVLGWQDGYDEDSDSYQKKEGDTLYTLCGKLAYNCDDLQCDYDFDWYMPYAENGDVYDTSMAISKRSEGSDFAWWLGECDTIITLLNKGELKAE